MKKIGDRFGRLIIVKEHKKIFTGNKWRKAFVCKCDCGNEVIRLSQNLNTRMSNCGCFNKELLLISGTKKGQDRYWNFKHGMFGTRFYGIYSAIVSRCNNPKNIAYRFYGKVGIKNKFKNFNHFYDSMYKSYIEHINKYGKKETTIDRIDSRKDYCPENCRWASYTEQANNRKDNLWLKYNGIEKTLAQWALVFKMSPHLAYKKITGLNYNTGKPNKGVV